MFLNWKSILTIFIFTALFSFASPVDAQFDQTDFGSRINIKSVPEIPGAYETVIVSLSAISYDLSRATIQWLVGGKVIDSGIGKSYVSIKTGGTGVETAVTAVITFGSVSSSKKLIIRPADATMLWQAVDSYIPPFYKGKALPSSEALIKVVVIPMLKDRTGKNLKEKDFSFSWKRNYNPDQGSSGYAKSSFLFKNSYMNDKETIEVIASSIAGNYVAKKFVTIPIFTPFITFYENRPLMGTKYENALGNDFTMYSDETTIVAEPYFFSPAFIDSPELKLDWRVGGQMVSGTAKNRLVVRNSGQSGSVNIRLDVESLPRLFQSLSKSLTIDLP